LAEQDKLRKAVFHFIERVVSLCQPKHFQVSIILMWFNEHWVSNSEFGIKLGTLLYSTFYRLPRWNFATSWTEEYVLFCWPLGMDKRCMLVQAQEVNKKLKLSFQLAARYCFGCKLKALLHVLPLR